MALGLHSFALLFLPMYVLTLALAMQETIGSGTALAISRAVHLGITRIGVWTPSLARGGRMDTLLTTDAGDDMVARVKDKGRKELESFKKRVLQVAALGRISKVDADWLVDRVVEIEKRISRMAEQPELEREFL